MDSGVGVRSFRDREIGRKNSELNDEHLVLKLIIARFNLADFWDVTMVVGALAGEMTREVAQAKN